jgi:regulator of replication initiation timing
METPSVVFYEHSFDDTIIKSLSKNVLNLGNECRALAEENARLKAEVDRLRAASFVTAVPVEQYERLIKAGDELRDSLPYIVDERLDDKTMRKIMNRWNAAKKGKPSV